MRILHIDTALEYRGGQQQLEYLLKARPQDGWAGVPASPLGQRIPPSVVLSPGQHPANLIRLARVNSFDGFAAHTPSAATCAILAGLPTVIHRRVDFVPSAWKYTRAKFIIAVSQAVAMVIQSIGVSQVDVVYDGVMIPELGVRRWALPGPVYGAAGALVAHKGHRVLIDAMTHTPGSLILAGEGPLRWELQSQIIRLGLGERVRLVGQVPMGDLFASIDVFVHPSLQEGLGQVVIEAMGAGLRIAASRAGGVPEVLGEAGEYAAAGDAAGLARGMERAGRRSPGEGVERAAGFSVERMVRGTEEVYRRVFGG